MKIIRSLAEFSCPPEPTALTIGNFDGLHRGHQAVLNLLKSKQKFTTVITFANHPSSILLPGQDIQLICTLEHRLKLLADAGISQTLLLDFTPEFAKQSAQAFIFQLRRQCPFYNLVLGHDATLGKDRQGGRAEM